MFGLSELVVILLVVIAVLAFKKLPGLARSAGQASRIFRSESRALRDEDPEGTPRVVPGTVVSRDERQPRP
ncbi:MULTISPECIES: twin-arginine translocase TatA/TatE family subunit [unclassified Streptomyces]|uniref:twin-arginine translocase TatA/TatE family subunit n=1 Tax=unclassified Streptomyces TaxID=2593676 RepID=UPI0005252301|nr:MULTISPECIES: twin-arginine translocase TatA/TatE family subunit [unclassified Streptomyces]